MKKFAQCLVFHFDVFMNELRWKWKQINVMELGYAYMLLSIINLYFIPFCARIIFLFSI